LFGLNQRLAHSADHGYRSRFAGLGFPGFQANESGIKVDLIPTNREQLSQPDSCVVSNNA
jgi:hypothetical protein